VKGVRRGHVVAVDGLVVLVLDRGPSRGTWWCSGIRREVKASEMAFVAPRRSPRASVAASSPAGQLLEHATQLPEGS
jgi:hypothetical protein